MRLQRLLLLLISILTAATSFAQTQPEVFDVNIYEGIYADLFNAYGSNTTAAQNHWLSTGLPSEGRRASFLFDPVYYIAHNPGVPTAYSAALQDFMTNGLPAGKRGSLEFDVKFYLAKYSDLAAAFGTNYLAAADHFMNQGLPCEGRQGSADFAVTDYVNMYVDVAAGYPRTLSCATGVTDYKQAAMHWLRRGKQQGRHGFGFLNVATECGTGQNIIEFGTIPSATPFTITVSHATGFASNVSVAYINAPQTQLTLTTGTPAQGQYSVSGGVYTFNGADKEQPIKITYNLTAVPTGYQRAFFTHRTDGNIGTGSMSNPFDASVQNDSLHTIRLDTILRHISEQTPGQVPLNPDTGAAYGPNNLIVCLDDSGVFQTRGNWDWVIDVGHVRGNPEDPTKANPGGFTVNQNWHIHGKGLFNTTVQVYDYLADPVEMGFPPNQKYPSTHSGLAQAFSTFGDQVGNVEISDLAIDGNFSTLKARNNSFNLNILPVNIRSDIGGNNIHHINAYNFAGEVGGVDISWEGFPVYIVSASGLNITPAQTPNNQIKYVLTSSPAVFGKCTTLTVANVLAEVAYNVVNGWNSTANTFGACQGMGGWDLSGAWFHDNIVSNSFNGFLIDSKTNRGVVVEFNQFNNFTHFGIVVGSGHKFDYYTIQYNTFSMATDHNTAILFQGNVFGATVTHNNILLSGSPPNTIGFLSLSNGLPDLGGVFQYNQIGTGSSVPDGNCVFDNWDTFANPIATPQSTTGSPCPAPAQAYATLQTDSNFVVNGAGNTLWATNTSGFNAPSIVLLDNGILTLYEFVWQAGTYAAPQGVQIPYDSCRVGATLFSGQTLLQNQCIESASGQYFLEMQSDGNLVLYDRVAGQVTWASNTYNHPGAHATMQTDGNFVVYASNGAALWASNSNGTVANHLDMQDDGRIVLYGPIWSSTNAAGLTTPALSHPASSECIDVGTGTGWTGTLGATGCFVSSNGRYKLYMQPDGGLVLYDRSVTPNKPLWANNNN